MPSSRSDSGRPAFPVLPRGVTDARVRKAVHAGWHRLSEGTRAALIEFYDRSHGLDNDDFQEELAELVHTHTDLQDLLPEGEFTETSDPRGIDMPAEPNPGAAGLPDPFGSANTQPPPPPPPPPPPSGGEPQTRR
ncbi:hypothetical protein [Streptomyces sp. ME18-1-4]|uniref:hypothetical protein n=1 Tax=Streptomyces sp. ME18-1-4 TaxID=3028685 RepID=UPI0029B4587C|nr:hypothetical protein [Streptomyces sp. ME18-1-4]MDX3245306.1 hypothetical protein [Streptomyces sp. ME18-1-4]